MKRTGGCRKQANLLGERARFAQPSGRVRSGGSNGQHARAFSMVRPGRGSTSSRIAMDDYLFRYHVKQCKSVVEDTRSLEIFNWTVSGGADGRAFCDTIRSRRTRS